MRLNRHFLAISALFIIGLAVRFVPLLYSSLPFNIDGFPLIRISEDIIDSGHWSNSYSDDTSDFIKYNAKMPVISLLISEFALIFGRTPIEVTQYVIPFISSIAIVILYLIAYRITGNELVSFFAGLALALNGFYVYLGAAVMKETVAIVLLILGVYLFYGRDDPKKRALAAVIFIILALTHHLTIWISFVMISLLVFTIHGLHWYQGAFQFKRFILDVLTGPFIFIFAVLYYELIDLTFYKKVSSLNDIALFASVFILGIILCISFSVPKKRKKKSKILFNKPLIFLIAGIALLLANHNETIFIGTIRTTTSLLVYLIPYLILCLLGFMGLNIIATRKTEHKPFIVSITLAPFLVITFAMLKGFDAFTFILVYRSYDYIDFGLAICAGIGAGYLINKSVKRLTGGGNIEKHQLKLKVTFSVAFLALCLSTVPLAYNGQEFYGVQDATYEHEFEAMKWISQNGADHHISTDERLNDIMGPYFDLDTDKTLPWLLKYSRPLENGTLLFVEDKWTGAGAQMSPMEPVKISENVFETTLKEKDVVYSTGGDGSDIYIIYV
ncbi:MAG: hypothetical protein JSW00_02985 [Thermoplasmata archaeon]|nr:MAG: hypothetical protein JSW00_02985 [Thermoplasmata archaeon]